MSGINIEVKANAGQATQQLEKVANALYEVQVNTGKVADGLAKTGRATENTGKSASKAADDIKKVSGSSDKAGNALMNLGRIAQDAPFGFVGITNNINPLLESFQRLKVETGSTSGALKSLAGSLMGGAGLGLAVSVATGVLTVMAQNGFFAASKAADKAKESVKEFNDQVTGIYQSSAKEQANVLTLVTALNDENLSRDKKVSALKELQKIAPEYFSGLKVENGLVNGLNEAYKKYSDSILEVIKNKIDEKRLESILNNIIIAEERRNMLQKGAIIQQQQINDLRAKGGVAEANSLERANKAIQTGLNNNSNLNVLYSQRDEILQRLAKRQFNGLIDEEKADQRMRELGESVRNAQQFQQTKAQQASQFAQTAAGTEEARIFARQQADALLALRQQAEANKPETFSYAQKKEFDTVQKTMAEAKSAEDSAFIADRAAPLISEAYTGKIEAGAKGLIGAMGISTTAKEANDRLTQLSQQLALKTPKFSGPTSDADAKRYDKAVGDLANPSVTQESKVQALQDIKKLAVKAADYAQQQENYYYSNNKSLKGFKYVPSNPFGN